MNQKGNEFKGSTGGKYITLWTTLLGFTPSFYQKGAEAVRLNKPVKVLDLGCGPGSLDFELARNAHPDVEFTGIDISEDQLDYARKHCIDFPCKFNFLNCSMDHLPFPEETFDWVLTSMAFHKVPSEVRHHAIAETARVLKSGGKFMLIDWSKPHLGMWGIVWLPLLVIFYSGNKDNWQNRYPELCAHQGLQLTEDKYINSVIRRQVFRKFSV